MKGPLVLKPIELPWGGSAARYDRGTFSGGLAGWRHIRGFTQGRRSTVNLKAAASTSPHSAIWGSTFGPTQEKSHFGRSCCLLFVTGRISAGCLDALYHFSKWKGNSLHWFLGSAGSPQDTYNRFLQVGGRAVGSRSTLSLDDGFLPHFSFCFKEAFVETHLYGRYFYEW